MNYIDITILIFALISAVKGFSQGLIIGLASLAGLILGVAFSLRYASDVSLYLQTVFGSNSMFVTIAAYVLCFAAISAIVHLIGKSIEKVVEIAALGLLNRIGGAVFGVLKVLFLFSGFFFLLAIADPGNHLISAEARQHSRFYKPIQWLLPSAIPFLEDQLSAPGPKDPAQQEKGEPA